MRRRRPPVRPPPGRTIPALFLAFALGGAAGWWIHAKTSSSPVAATVAPGSSIAPSVSAAAARDPDTPRPSATIGSIDPDGDPIGQLRRHSLRVPIDHVNLEAMRGGFAEPRKGEPHGHEAVDLLAPRDTPVRAVEDGKIAKLFFSKAGGNTIYQFDPSERFCYYYAHLDHYASGLHDGQAISKGDVIGYVGTTGNASANTPHLHFAILKLGDDKRWWHGTAIDPYLVFRQ